MSQPSPPTHWRLELHDGLGELVVDVPDSRVNTLGARTMHELAALVDDLHARRDLKALVIRSDKPGCFIAGADIKELQALSTIEDARHKAELGQALFQRIAELPYPTVAIIAGVCLGGGCELALACDYRIAVDDPKTRIGLPETQLGIIPGWGGCVRLPRLIGLAGAIDLVCSGRALDARKALKRGLVDRVTAAPFVDETLAALLHEVAAGGQGIDARRSRARGGLGHRLLLDGNPIGRAIVRHMARKRILAKTRGQYPAPPAALETMVRCRTGSIRSALAHEAERFSRLATTPLCKHLVGLFFANESLKKSGGDDGGRARTIARTGVLGAGVMGGGIAWLFADGGCRVRVKDLAWPPIAGAMRTAHDYFRQLRKRRKRGDHEIANGLARISGTLDHSGFADAQFVVEAVLEKLEVKRDVLAELEHHVDDDCLIATNTSSLRVADMATALRRPERFCGFHFFNPVNRMPLVEVVPGPRTSPETIATACAFARRLGKTAIVVGDCPGFLVNRILLPYLNEAARLLEEGAEIERVDRLATAFGMPMGPFRLADEVGIDVGVKVARILAEGYGERMRVSGLLDVLHDEQQLLGRKGGAGFYTDHAADRPRLNLDATAAVERYCREHRLEHRHHDDAEIIDRLLLIMVAEASRCLSEGVVADADQLDMALILGTGFPPFRGGLLRWAEERGLTAIRNRLVDLAQRCGDRFAPTDLIDHLATFGGTFHGHQDLPSAA